MGRLTLLFAVVGLGMIVLGVMPGARRADAAQLLDNPGFEDWSGSTPSGWSVVSMSAESSSNAVSGLSAALTLSGGVGRLRQSLAASPGATYSGSIAISAPGSVSVALRLIFFDDLHIELEMVQGSAVMNGTFHTLSTSRVAPAGTESVLFQVDFSGSAPPGEIFADSAALNETAAPATATATPTPTDLPTETPTPMPPTATPSSETATPAPPGSSTPTRTTAPGSTSAATGTATRSATATRTGTATRTPTTAAEASATRTPTARPPTPTRTATAIATATRVASSTATPAARPASLEAFGGFLLNGNFEDVEDGRPVGWSKFGGTMGVSADAFRGDSAATLDSTTSSTKWLYQVVSATPGNWYAASAEARLDGSGEAFIRLTWYAADDGSGTSLSQDESDVASGGGWHLVGTGAVQAPLEAHSLRVRLMLRPAGGVTAYFDDAQLVAASAPAAIATAPDPSPSPAAGPSASRSAVVNTPAGAARSATPRPGQTALPSRISPSSDSESAVNSSGLRLSEVLSDPEQTGRDSAFEWVELVNTGTEAVSLLGWSIGDVRSSDPLPAASVPSGGFVVVAAKSVQLPPEVLLVRVADGEIGSGLNNSGDTIRLIAPDGTEVDALSFGDDDSVFDPPPPAPSPGKTLAVRSAASDPDATNWALSSRPTPGEANEFPAATPVARPSGERTPSAGRADTAEGAALVNRGEGHTSLLWGVAAAGAAALIFGAPAAWAHRRKKPHDGS
ncbi:MAG: lamin tail domain-containing protein [Tepidiformaceae bacterium]